MRVIIPAAGRGTRLLPHTSDRPKCLVPVGGVPILERLLGQLYEVGGVEVVCVLGYRGELLERHVDPLVRRPPVTYIRNEDYRTTDNIVSLWATVPLWDGEVVVIDSDVVMADRLVESVVRGGGDAMVVDAERPPEQMDMKVELRHGAVWHLDKALPAERVGAEFFGVSRWSAEGAADLARQLAEMIRAGTTDTWYPYAIRQLAKRRRIRPIYARSEEWIEVDSVADLATADATARARVGWARA
jgi:choline kinase